MHTNLNVPIKTDIQLENEIENMTNLIHTAAEISTPSLQKNANRTNHDISFEIRMLIKEKRKLRKIWQQSRSPSDKKRYNKKCKILKQQIYESKNASIATYLKGLSRFENGDSCLWRATKYLNRPIQRNVTVKNVDGQYCRSDKEIVESFAKHLEQTFNPIPLNSSNHIDNVLSFLEAPCQMDWPIRSFDISEVQNEIDKLNNKKSPGLDLIDARVVKLLPKKTVKLLTIIFNSMIRLSCFPLQWKCAEVIMLAKPNKPETELSSYRPISLLSTFSKIFERIFSRRMLSIIDDRSIIPDHQFGFRDCHGTPEQCHRIVNFISDAFERKHYCSAVFLDVQQAFDRVWHPGLLYKIKQLFPAPYFLFIKSYLSDRTFYVKHKYIKSTLCNINAGVPQGSVLGPILYTIYTADIPNDNNLLLATYADDTAILASSESAKEASTLVQNYLFNLQNWLTNWNVQINTQKSKHVTFTLRKGDCAPVFLNNSQIPQSGTVKYLGMHIDRRLTWKDHIRAKRTQLNIKTKKMYWLLGPTSELSLENKLLLYKAILKPVWTYGIQLWGTASNSNIEILQRYQAKTLRLITNAPWFVSNDTIHNDLCIDTVRETVKNHTEKYLNRLLYHPNTLAKNLLINNHNTKRLKKCHVLEIPCRFN